MIQVGIIGLAAWLVLSGSPGGTQEAGRPRVALRLDPCVGAASEQVAALAALELRVAFVDPSSPPASGATAVHVDCDGVLAQLRVDDPVTGKSLLRTLDPAQWPQSARARLIGTAIAELVAASWVELVVNPEPAVPAVGPPALEEERQAALQALQLRIAPWELRLVAGPTGIVLFRGPPILWGIALRFVAGNATFPLAMIADGAVQHGGAKTELGAVSADVAGGSVALGLRLRFGPGELVAGVGFRLAAVRLTGDPAGEQVREGRVAGPWGGPIGTISIGARATGRLYVELGAEGGYSLFSVVGQVGDSSGLTLAGPWAAVRLALGLAL